MVFGVERRFWPGLMVLGMLAWFSASGCGRARDDAQGGAGSEPTDAGAPNVAGGGASAGSDVMGEAGEPGMPRCNGGRLACDDSCIDPQFDPRHCGDCDTVCGVGELCSAGRCDVVCLGGSTRCGDRCVDVDHDPANCGGCAVACSNDEVCSNGVCGVQCFGGTTRCEDECVNLQFDAAHCGSCSKSCTNGRVCSNGSCTADCADGKLACNGTCINPTLDVLNCGGCGMACAAGELCSGGQCGNTCSNAILCDNACVDLLTDSANCGGCNRACLSGQTCVNGSCGLHCELLSQTQCGGACKDLYTDAKNCGGCNAVCDTGKVCKSAACVCSGGMTACLGVCTDTTTSAANCGACGVACGVNEACANSVCDCKPGTTRCGALCIDTSTNAANCGACDALCPAGKVCTLGVCAPPSSDWPTFQYDIAHSGQNSAETGKPPLSLSWSRKLGTGALNTPALASGRLFVTAGSYFSTTAPIYALNVSDGSDVWSYNFGNVSSLGAPSVFSGTVYLGNGKPTTGNALLWSINAVTGVANWTAPLSAQWETYWAPIRVGDVVYINGGTYGGLYGINALDGTQKFFVSLDQYDEWSPAYFQGKLYTFIAGNFRTHDPSTGAVSNNLSISWNWSGYSMTTAPVFGSSYGYVIAPPNLYAIDPTTHLTAWTANGTYKGTPAVAGDSVYGVSAGNLIVRDATTGALKWTFVGDTALSYPPVIANGFVYVASDANLYAVEITTHAQVDHETSGGFLTLGNDRLIVAGADGTVTAYLLSK
ncbi:MAG: MXAN_6577-like cysteine-rich protein [Pseudomonadota bacterium]